jgi:hypothetical protein
MLFIVIQFIGIAAGEGILDLSLSNLPQINEEIGQVLQFMGEKFSTAC